MHLIQACLRLVEKRALPELWPIPQGEDGVVDALSLTLCALLEVLSLGRALEAAQGQHHTDGRALAQRAAQLLGKLYKTEDKAKALKIAFMKALDDMVSFFTSPYAALHSINTFQRLQTMSSTGRGR